MLFPVLTAIVTIKWHSSRNLEAIAFSTVEWHDKLITDSELRFELSYDNACKYLAEKYPVAFASWLLPVWSSPVSVLKTELSLEPIRADAVTFLQAANQILHLEFQTLPTSNPPLPIRMLDYSIRLKRQYQCDVEQVVIFLQRTNATEAYTQEYRDRTTTHRYRVIRMWEQDAAIFLENSALLPLATLTRTNSPRTLLAQVAEQIARIPDREQQQNLSGCAQILAGLKFEKDLIRQLFREKVMRESVIYQDILQKGLQQGQQQGQQQGRQQEALSFVTRLLDRRLGTIDSALIERVQELTIEQLESLGEALLDFSAVADLVAWLEQQEGNEN